MYKLIIIDDEKIIRRGFREMIDWSTLGFSVEAEASNGKQALELISENHFDAAIVDIRMPGMSGLKLIEKVRQKNRDIKFVILSGYSDFAYAQKAIEFNVEGYLLKPSDKKEVYKVFRKLKDKLDGIKREQEHLKQMKGKLEVSLRSCQETFLSNLIKLKMGKDEVDASMENFNLRMTKPHFHAAVMEIDNFDLVLADWNNTREKDLRNEFLEALEHVSGRTDRIHFLHDNDIVMLWNHDIDGENEILKNCFEIKETVKREFSSVKVTVTIGISCVFSDLSLLGKAYCEAKKAVEHKLVAGMDSIICFSEIRKAIEVFTGDRDEKAFVTIVKGIIEAVKAGSSIQIKNMMKMLTEKLLKDEKAGRGTARQACLDVISGLSICIPDFYEKIWPLCGERLFPFYRIRQFETLSLLMAWLENIALSTSEFLSMNQKMGINNGVEKSVEYIDQHFNEELKVQDMARYACVSVSYYSVIFKKITGMSFTDYLILKRLEHGKKMLHDMNARVGEIALKVGYKDYGAFYKAFKNMYGIAPTDYQVRYADVKAGIGKSNNI